jgi:cathepsin D
VKEASDDVLDAGGVAAGIMGLAFQPLASTEALPFWQALVKNTQFTSPQMSFWLTRQLGDDGQSTGPGGVLTLGGSNATLYTGDIQFLDMPSSGVQSYWQLQMRSACRRHILAETAAHYAVRTLDVTVQGNKIKIATGDAGIAAIDTGTTLIGGPSDDVRNIWAAVPNSEPMDGSMEGFYSFRT